MASHLLVAAFDFGTTYSGYAFSFRHDPSTISLNQNWYSGSKLISLKTPTCILLDPDEKFHSFGFDAENKYSGLAEEKKHLGWLFFRRFKMLLHNNQKLSRQTTVQDINGKRMFALDIISLSIRYLRCHLLNEVKKKVFDIKESDIKYVITIPAIWDDSGKQFMRMAALQADIDAKSLTLALEPEAASIWCQTLTADDNDPLCRPGARYMVVDLGGGTADISVHEKNDDGTLKELHQASGGPWGGMNVDTSFIALLEKMFGIKIIERFKEESMYDYFDMLQQLETIKRSITCGTHEYITFRMPLILRELSEKETGKKLENQVNASSFASSVDIKRDKMRIKCSIVQDWFDGPIGHIIRHIKGILSETNMSGISSVLLVGGFGESAYVQEKIKNAIPNTRLIVPQEPGLTVLKGAVIFGHRPSILSARIVKYSYGIDILSTFDASKDDASHATLINGQRIVKNRFLAFKRAGEVVSAGQKCKKKLFPICMDMTCLPVFYSLDPNPSCTTDPGCKYLGTLTVYHHEGNSLRDKEIEVMMIFGDTEITVEARIKKTRKVCRTVLDCLLV